MNEITQSIFTSFLIFAPIGIKKQIHTIIHGLIENCLTPSPFYHYIANRHMSGRCHYIQSSSTSPGERIFDMITVISKLFRNLRLCNQMLVFSMHRNRVQRIYFQRINQLDIFLARMSADMYIFENHICTCVSSLITPSISHFGIGWELEYNGIIWLNGNLRHAGCHATMAMTSPWLPVVMITVFFIR